MFTEGYVQSIFDPLNAVLGRFNKVIFNKRKELMSLMSGTYKGVTRVYLERGTPIKITLLKLPRQQVQQNDKAAI